MVSIVVSISVGYLGQRISLRLPSSSSYDYHQTVVSSSIRIYSVALSACQQAESLKTEFLQHYLPLNATIHLSSPAPGAFPQPVDLCTICTNQRPACAPNLSFADHPHVSAFVGAPNTIILYRYHFLHSSLSLQLSRYSLSPCLLHLAAPNLCPYPWLVFRNTNIHVHQQPPIHPCPSCGRP